MQTEYFWSWVFRENQFVFLLFRFFMVGHQVYILGDHFSIENIKYF